MKNSITRIENLLRNALNIENLDVIDESNLHVGHAHMLENKHELTHVCVKISSKDLQALSKVEQHRLLYKILHPEIDNGLHSIRFQII